MLNGVEKTLMNQSVYDLIIETLNKVNSDGVPEAISYNGIFCSVKVTLYNVENVTDWELSAIIDGHLNALINDHLVEISTDKELTVMFAYVTY